MNTKCAIEGCESPRRARGLCNKHYLRLRSRGALPLLSRTTEDRFWEKVHKTDTCWEWQATSKSSEYGGFYFGGRVGYAHRYSYELHYGDIPDGAVVDHICYNKRCVNPVHLRLVTKSQNGENRSGLNVDNTSGYRGVSRDRSGRWRAYAGKYGKYYHGGVFDTPEEAAAAARQLRAELFTHHQEWVAG